MRKFILNILLFVCVALIGYMLWVFRLGNTGMLRTVNYRLGNYGHLFSRITEADTTKNVDILFLGSSHSYRTFDTRYFDTLGYRSFNLGSSSQTPIQTYVLLQRCLATMNPRLVVFEVHPDVMSNDGVEGAVDLISNVSLTRYSTQMALTYRNLKVFNTWLYAYYRNTLRHKLDKFHEDSYIDGSAYVSGGFTYMPDEESFVADSLPSKTINMQPRQLAALEDCLSLIKSMSIPYILVEVPPSKALMNSYTNHDDFVQKMSQLGPFYRLNPMPGPDSTYYYDADHLKLIGAHIACRQMAEIIQDNQLISK